jgi:RimJ/RimL family protein N-acetyltransferase
LISAVYLETDRLALRRLTDADADHLFALDSDPEVMRFLTGGRPHTQAFIVEKALPAYLAYYARFESLGFWAAIDKATGEFAGWFHFRPFDQAPEETELGYRLKRAYWGRGLATEGSMALVRKGFCTLGVSKVVATTMSLNVRSRRVMEKVGLRLEIEYDYPGAPFPGWRPEDCKEVKYGLTKRQWELSNAC